MSRSYQRMQDNVPSPCPESKEGDIKSAFSSVAPVTQQKRDQVRVILDPLHAKFTSGGQTHVHEPRHVCNARAPAGPVQEPHAFHHGVALASLQEGRRSRASFLGGQSRCSCEPKTSFLLNLASVPWSLAQPAEALVRPI